MSLHHSLRELVSARGPGVLDEAEEFRGVLDDFLAEDEATLGELNLLVDAVRLGALRRVLEVMAHGAEPEAAIREAGAALARDRGTDDPARSCWALASLCFALGKVEEPVVRSFLGATGTQSAPARPTAPAEPGAAVGRSTAERPATEVLSRRPEPRPAPPTTAVGGSPAPPGAAPYAGPVPGVIPEQRSSRVGVFLLVLLVGLLVGGLVATGIILLRSDGDPTASDDPTDRSTSRRTGPATARVADTEMVLPFKVGEGEDATSTLYAVDVGGDHRQLTEGPFHALPGLSPDRQTLTYAEGPQPYTQYRMDLETGTSEPFFPEPGPCDNALRPGWSPDGSQVALLCTGDDVEPEGIYLAGADGSGLEVLVDNPLVDGAPTWISDDQFVFGLREDDSDGAPTRLWTGFTDGSSAVPLELDVPEGTLTHMDWSPDAEKLLFLVSPVGGDEVGSVWIANGDGTDAEVVAEGSYAHPVWSPDGRSIGLMVVDPVTGAGSLAYVDVGDDPLAPPQAIPDPPPGEPGVPVWATR